MAIRVSPLMGLGAIAQGYEQQRQEAARRQLIEEQLRAQALARAAQGAIGATLTAPGGIGGGVGSSPYAGLSNLGGGGAGGGDPINAPPPGSAPNVPYDSGDSYGNAPKSYATSQGDPTQTADAGVTDLPIEAGTPQPSTQFLPNTDQDIPMWMRQGVGAGGMRWQPGQGYVPPQFPQQIAPQQARPPIVPPQPMPPQPPGQFRNLSPQAANAPPTFTPQPVPGGYQPQAAAAPAARPPIVPQQVIPPQRLPPGAPTSDILPAGGRQPAAGQQQPGGGGQQQFNPADLLNPAKSLEFASQIAMRVKAANPNASNEVIAQATTDLMKSLATQDRLGTALAIAQMRNVTQTGNLDERIRHDIHTEGQGDVRLQQGDARLQQGDTRLQQGQQKIELQKQRLAQQVARYKELDAQKEQARKDAMAKGDRSTYIRVITAQLAEIRSQLGNMMRTADMSPEEKEAAQAKEKELTAELARVQGQTRPQ